MSTAVEPASGRASPPGGRGAALRALVRDTVRGLRGHDLPLHAAGATFYAGVAVVPALLVAIWGVSLALGEVQVRTYGDELAAALSAALGAPPVARGLVQAAAGMTALTALLAVVPATLYGEGLRRAFAAILGRRKQAPGWRGRLQVIPVLAAAPLVALVVLALTPRLADLLASGSGLRAVLGIYLSFLLDWLAISPLLTYVYRVVAPGQLSWRAAAWGGYATGSVLAGFVQGFLLFLALPLDINRPFGGYRPIGAMVAVALWLWLLHLIVLVGYELTRQIDARGGVPWVSASNR